MGRRRYQRPSVFKSKGRRPEWYFRARVDAFTADADGIKKKKRPEKRYALGYCDEIGKREAEKRRDEILDAVINRPQVLIPSQVQFAHAIDAYKRDHLPTLRDTTQKTQRNALAAQFEDQLGALRMCDIDVLTVQRWLSSMKLSFRTKEAYLGLLRGVWAKAQEWGFVVAPFPKGRYSLGVDRYVKGTEMPSIDHLRRLLAALDDPFRAMAEIALYAGLRISEIRGLQWGDIQNGVLTIRRRVSMDDDIDVPKSGRGFRSMDARPVAGVLARIPKRGGSDWIFYHPGAGYANCLERIRQAREAAGIQVNRFAWHHLRAYCNTMMRLEGADAVDRQAVLGHATEQMNAVYVHQSADDLKRRGDLMMAVQASIMGHTKGIQ